MQFSEKIKKISKYIIGIIIICAIIIFILYLKNSNTKLNSIEESQTISNSNTVNKNREYIVQDSKASPTGKEFIGIFSDNLVNMTDMGNAATKKYYETTITNMKTFSSESFAQNLITGNYDKVLGNDYYYNSDNNHIIGERFWTSNKTQFSTTLQQNYNTSIEEFMTTHYNSNFSIFFNFHNDNESQEKLNKYNRYNNYLNTINNLNQKEFDYKNYEFIYWNIGDILYVLTNFKDNENRLESLNIAYDENQSPEEVIKNWYDTVDIITEITDNNEDKINNNSNEFSNLDNNNQVNDNKEEYIFFPNFVTGFPIEQYTSRLEELGLRYEIEKVIDYNYDDNVVVNIDPSFAGEISKETVVKLKVTDNIYDISVNADTRNLMLLAGIDMNKYNGYYDSFTNNFVEPEVQLTIKIKNDTIFDGKVSISNNTDTLGIIKGKKTDEFNIEVTIEGIKIQQTIPYLCQCSTYNSLLTVGGEGS